jgi:hypothetical protein
MLAKICRSLRDRPAPRPGMYRLAAPYALHVPIESWIRCLHEYTGFWRRAGARIDPPAHAVRDARSARIEPVCCDEVPHARTRARAHWIPGPRVTASTSVPLRFAAPRVIGEPLSSRQTRMAPRCALEDGREPSAVEAAGPRRGNPDVPCCARPARPPGSRCRL